jgi:hypothetical protein
MNSPPIEYESIIVSVSETGYAREINYASCNSFKHIDLRFHSLLAVTQDDKVIFFSHGNAKLPYSLNLPLIDASILKVCSDYDHKEIVLLLSNNIVVDISKGDVASYYTSEIEDSPFVDVVCGGSFVVILCEKGELYGYDLVNTSKLCLQYI